MKLMIRADASARVGSGHLMRCLALAQAWQDEGGRSAFILAEGTEKLENRLKSEGMDIFHVDATPGSLDDAVTTADLARREGAVWVVLDGYHFNSGFQRILKDSQVKLLVIDDMGHGDCYFADIILNQNIHAAEDLYTTRKSYSRLLLGTDHVLLRREFRKWSKWKREVPVIANKILVTMGGGDPENVTLKVIRALKEFNSPDMEAMVIIGPSNPHVEVIRKEICHLPFAARLLDGADNMGDLMAWADMAISAAGSTSWELAFMGLPAAVITLAENQKSVAEGLQKLGAVINLGPDQNLSIQDVTEAIQHMRHREARIRMAEVGRRLVDGLGTVRVIRYMAIPGIRLRQVEEADCRMIWEWTNSPGVRSVSFSTTPIPWEEHLDWFGSKMNCSSSKWYMFDEENGIKIGQVRFDIVGSEAVVSVIVDECFRGKGYGQAMIRLACDELFAKFSINSIHAYVKPDNIASLHAFLNAGFQDSGPVMFKGHAAGHFVLRTAGTA